jgi:hypothetical protein
MVTLHVCAIFDLHFDLLDQIRPVIIRLGCDDIISATLPEKSEFMETGDF